MSKQAFYSLDPEGFSQGGGLFDDVDAVVTRAQFTTEAPEGYTAEGNPLFFVLGLQIDGADDEVEQRYSMGAKAGDNFSISEDGLGLVPEGPGSKLGGSSKFGLFMAALKAANFPIGTLSGTDGSLANIVGLRAHFNRMPDPERKGLQTGKKEKKYPETTLVVTKVHALPGEKAAKKGGKKDAAAPKGAAASKQSAEASEEDIQVAEETLMAVIAAKGGSVQKSQLPLLVARELAKHPRKAEIGKLVYSEDFLNRNTAWSFDASSNPQVITAE
jgi:hypothetical protein